MGLPELDATTEMLACRRASHHDLIVTEYWLSVRLFRDLLDPLLQRYYSCLPQEHILHENPHPDPSKDRHAHQHQRIHAKTPTTASISLPAKANTRLTVISPFGAITSGPRPMRLHKNAPVAVCHDNEKAETETVTRLCEVAHALCLGQALYQFTISNYTHPETRSLPTPSLSLGTAALIAAVIAACGLTRVLRAPNLRLYPENVHSQYNLCYDIPATAREDCGIYCVSANNVGGKIRGKVKVAHHVHLKRTVAVMDKVILGAIVCDDAKQLFQHISGRFKVICHYITCNTRLRLQQGFSRFPGSSEPREFLGALASDVYAQKR
ncbi:hypothetical protein B0H19DRAFT_1064736 [Mycena capillaripes]|nr:hypothetical protein B0H19DRAFT_1064736 [Mycena capillaripes]